MDRRAVRPLTHNGRPSTPRLADAAFYSNDNEAAAKAKGVDGSASPTLDQERRPRREQKKRWFRNGQK
jgi:hypothetical protein